MYRQIHHTFWTDPDIKKLSLQEKFLFLYFITNPCSHYSGIYYLPLSLIQEETELKDTDIKKSIDNLINKFKMIKYDFDYKIIWVKNMLKYQINKNINIVQLKGIANNLQGLHHSKLIIEYLEYNNTLSIPYQYPMTNQYTDKDTDKDKDKDKQDDASKELSNGHLTVKDTLPHQKLIEEYKKIKGYDKIPNWDKEHFKRHVKTSNQLISSYGLDKSIEYLIMTNNWANKKGLEWTLETVNKKIPDFILKEKEIDPYD